MDRQALQDEMTRKTMAAKLLELEKTNPAALEQMLLGNNAGSALDGGGGGGGLLDKAAVAPVQEFARRKSSGGSGGLPAGMRSILATPMTSYSDDRARAEQRRELPLQGLSRSGADLPLQGLNRGGSGAQMLPYSGPPAEGNSQRIAVEDPESFRRRKEIELQQMKVQFGEEALRDQRASDAYNMQQAYGGGGGGYAAGGPALEKARIAAEAAESAHNAAPTTSSMQAATRAREVYNQMSGGGRIDPSAGARPSELARIITAPGSDTPILTNRTPNEIAKALAAKYGGSAEEIQQFAKSEMTPQEAPIPYTPLSAPRFPNQVASGRTGAVVPQAPAQEPQTPPTPPSDMFQAQGGDRGIHSTGLPEWPPAAPAAGVSTGLVPVPGKSDAAVAPETPEQIAQLEKAQAFLAAARVSGVSAERLRPTTMIRGAQGEKVQRDWIRDFYTKALEASGGDEKAALSTVALNDALDKADKSALTKITNSNVMMQSFMNQLPYQTAKLEELLGKIERVDARLLNKPLVYAQRDVIGTPNEAALALILKELSTEITKIASGASGSVAEPSIYAQEKWDKIHDPNLPIESLRRVIEESTGLAKARMESAESARQELLDRIAARASGVPQNRRSTDAPAPTAGGGGGAMDEAEAYLRSKGL